jgi:hypothetical protein
VGELEGSDLISWTGSSTHHQVSMAFVSVYQRLLLQALLISLASHVVAKLVNATIDDAYGDTLSGVGIEYTPAYAWRDGRLPCRLCKAEPNPALLYNGTWHDSTVCPKLAQPSFENH